ncbi:tyrosine-type recombinase/integrase [Thermodesulfobacteriota bacterium]
MTGSYKKGTSSVILLFGLEYYSVDRKLKYIPSDEQIRAVKQICDPDQSMLIEFLGETGAGINEALRLTANDVFDDYVILYTRKSKNSDLIPRKVPKPSCFNGLTFEGRVFKVWTFYPEFLKRKVRKLKQPYWNFHNLRHRYASKLSKEGKPLFEIMMLLGHSNLSTTQNYLQLIL